MRVLFASALTFFALSGAVAAEDAVTPSAAAPADAASGVAAGDPAKGEIVFKKCMACHAVGPNAKTKVGPPLNGIVGAHWAHFEGYPYSDEIKAGAAAGKAWEPANLEAWITNPKDLAPKTKMAFAGVKNAQERADLIAFLSQFGADGTKK
ncbi:c-type cytochrome [Xanthobacter agilis]|uniref:c-type cytochrome n=1 Tax=Xanthobacter agilis TaxID=47492 RepID=UPI003727BB03